MTTNPATCARVTFWGAARTVTGSMHLVECQGKKILLDCGSFQGRRTEAYQRNSQFPFAPKEIDAVVLSHAHIDHCGNLPNLVRQGFRGPIHCTPATADLMDIMLHDSAKIQQEDAEYLNDHREKGQRPVEPLYTAVDVDRTVRVAHPLAYDLPERIAGDIQLRLVDAGHLLGSAMVSLQLPNGRRITFTGDIGRRAVPILRDPAPVPAGDLLITESTYGGRKHPPVEELTAQLGAIVRKTYERGGKVLIPSFAVGRTQTVLYYLHQLFHAKQLPDLPIYVDSPLATSATEIYRRHPECFDEDALRLLHEDPEIFGEGRVRFLRTVQDSKTLNGRHDSFILIASSGMCESGRILHHLKHNVEDPRTTIAIIGYQAPNTLGYRLVQRLPKVRFLDRWRDLRAEVVVLNGFSGHADNDELLQDFAPLVGKVAHVRLVHGEEDAGSALATALREAGFVDVQMPERGDSIEV